MKKRELQESEFVAHESCPSCGSRDNLARYTDGHAYCFGCNYYEAADGETQQMGASPKLKALPPTQGRVEEAVLEITGEIQGLPKRAIKAETCRLWDYRVGNFNDRSAQIAYYRDPVTRRALAAKVRFQDKSFAWIGNPKDVPLYGQWLWRDGGKMVVVCEGELDALSISQIQGNKWPVVSVQNGAQGAVKSVRKALEWLNKYETVVFFFDMDEPGRKAAIECSKLFPPGKAKIANINNAKDANELLQLGRGPEILDGIWGATVYRPDGIVSASDLWDVINNPEPNHSVPYPYEALTEKTGGIRKQELVTITAGSGIGKSLFCREIAFDLMTKKNWKVGYIALEENTKRTLLGFMGMHLDKPLHISRDGVTEDEFHKAFNSVSDKLFLYDSFGSIEPENLMERLRYMAIGLQCDALFVDHISIAISGLEEIDERRALDVMMTKLRSLVEETGVAMFVVSHLKRPSMSDKGHEQGMQTSLAQLRGSAAIGQLSDLVIGLERNQQGDNANETIVRVLKNRFNGDTGVASTLFYSKDTGRLREQPFKQEEADDTIY